jgi:AcrR family transcriptional regulator
MADRRVLEEEVANGDVPAANRGGAPAQERELRARGKRTMRKLLDAGMTVFSARGYHAARVDDIVKVARTSHGTFYLYFANKEDLFRALALDVAAEMTELAESLGPVPSGADGLAELRSWLERFSTLYEHYGPVIRAWTEAETTTSEFGQMGTDVLAGFTRTLVDRLRESSNAGRADAQIAALALVAMIERFHYYVSSRSMRFDRDRMLDTLATIIHTGVFGGTRPET